MISFAVSKLKFGALISSDAPSYCVCIGEYKVEIFILENRSTHLISSLMCSCFSSGY